MAAPTTSPPSASPASSAIRYLARRVKRWWSANRIGLRDDEVEIPLAPLGFWPHRASALLGHGETEAEAAEPSPQAGYIFHTLYVPSTGGQIRFRICLKGLKSSGGTLYVNINGLDGYGAPLSPKIERIPIERLIASGGEISISTLGIFGNSYAVVGALADGAEASADAIEIYVTGADSDEAHSARLEAARRGFLAEPGEGELAKIIVNTTPNLTRPISQMCTAEQMADPIYGKTARFMGQQPTRHRKQWEFVYIFRALKVYGVLRPGARGLGFGVGVEPLPSILARRGCTIVATDLAADDHRARVWTETEQLGSSLRQIFHPGLCDEQEFFERVSFRNADMNDIPADLTDFDFTWSSCAYEHLGSIEAGLAFFENSLRCLKPGGIAIHTTELNLSSNDRTLDQGTTVIFRRRDFEELARRLIAKGHKVAPISFDSGQTELDRVIDLPPYSNDPHLKLALMRWVSTSFGMIVRKGPD